MPNPTPVAPPRAMPPAPGPRYRFGVFELDARSGELFRHGIRVRLRGKPIDILTVLLESPGEVVTREALRERLWPADTFVDFDHGLNSAMNRLREALGDEADNPRFVETLPRRGYRFVGALLPDRPPPPSIPAQLHDPGAPAASLPGRPLARMVRSRRLAAIGALLLVALAALGVETWRMRPPRSPARVMLAVLPFLDLTTGQSVSDYFTEGLTDEMIARLGAVQPARLGVIARTTAMRYRDQPKSVREIGQELNVAYVLEGSVRRAADRVRLTVQLVKVSDQTPLWSETFEPSMGDVLMVQREVAVRVARALAVEVFAREEPMGTRSSQAYEHSLRGRYQRQRATAEGALEGLEHFRQAIAIDPGYAEAWAGLADCYRLMGSPGWELRPPSDLLEKAKAAANRAVELNPLLADGYTVRAIVRLNYDWDATAAERDLEQALRLNPSLALAHQYQSSVYTVTGRLDEAIAAARRAAELDPLSPGAQTTLAVRMYYAGRYADAIRQFERVTEAQPEFPVAWWGLGEALREAGRPAEGLDALRRALALSAGNRYLEARLAYAQAVGGEPERARAALAELDARPPETYQPPFHRALMLVGLGDDAGALAELEAAARDRSGWIPFLRVEPAFGRLRDREEFQRLLAAVR